eukprot:Seg4952.2 transcript_id=Seg4952.2/GoldUCD/mRNA.D3Y31 product="Protein mab-21-like 2" protein_id=Seg4952.2/GoldUCD/D3Y31
MIWAFYVNFSRVLVEYCLKIVFFPFTCILNLAEFTLYKLKPSLQKRWRNLADSAGLLLSAERVVARFASLVSQAVGEINQKKESPFKLEIVTNHPAVTIRFKKKKTTIYNVDLAPVIEVTKWPEQLTEGWETRARNGWPSDEIIENLKKNTPVCLAPKLYRDQRYEKRDYLWRYAFNKGEKKLLKKSNPGQSNSCRKNVLRILKGLILDLNWNCLRSYHMKTVLLHESESWPRNEQWSDTLLEERVLSAVRRLRSFVNKPEPKCKHFFLPGTNILEGLGEKERVDLVKKVGLFLKDPAAAMHRILKGDEEEEGQDNDTEAGKNDKDGSALEKKSGTAVSKKRDQGKADKQGSRHSKRSSNRDSGKASKKSSEKPGSKNRGRGNQQKEPGKKKSTCKVERKYNWSAKASKTLFVTID